MSEMVVVSPAELPAPHGFSHGVAVPPGRMHVHVAGQTAADAGGHVAGAFAAQFERALIHVLAVVGAAGGRAGDVARMRVYVTSLDDYRASRADLTAIWRRHMGRHYPAMSLVQVAGLVDAGALVEIEADAHIAPGGRP